MTRVLLGIPTGSSVNARTMASVSLALYAAPCPIVLRLSLGCFGFENRWALARDAVDEGFSHLWLVDADQTVPADALERLLAHDADLVGATYNSRGLPLAPTVRVWDADGKIGIPNGPLPTEPFVAAAIGSGCKLVKTAALKRIPQPWFALEWNPDGSLRMSDDVWFCRQARSVGIDTICDPTIDVKHVGDYEY